MLERVTELVGSPKGLWDSRKRMCKIEDEFDRYQYVGIRCQFQWPKV